ncbi:MAG TPA: MgtC/SapB family protein [Gemmataceae bacterium]|nr:MgtC/SapB family protein [Gemmataceae bacterium]
MDILWEELSGGWHDVGPFVRVVVRLLAAALLGGILGVERQYEHKSAGMRTHMLVAMGAALFTAAPLVNGVAAEHVTRIIQGVAAGIGFVGGGTILKMTDQHEVRGLTTAANIWLAAAVGVAAGAGWLFPAFVGTVLALVVLYVLGHVERWCGMPRGH